MTDVEKFPLSSITAKAKESFKESEKKQKYDAKAKQQKDIRDKKRSFKQSQNGDNNNEGSPLKRRKVSDKQDKKKKIPFIAFNLTPEEQKLRSVIKLSNMPEGLEEDQLRLFFRQFGTVTRLCLKRNLYGVCLKEAYIEFCENGVGQIVEETLDCSVMYGRKIKCELIPPDQVNGAAFFKTNSLDQAEAFKRFENGRTKWKKVAIVANLRFKMDAWMYRLIDDEDIINDNLKRNGIDYEFHGYKEARAKRDEEAEKAMEEAKAKDAEAKESGNKDDKKDKAKDVDVVKNNV